jgi:hypothetical protein
MYGVPSDLNLVEIIDNRIDSINIQEYQVIIVFEKGITIAVESEIKVTNKEQMVSYWDPRMGWTSVIFQNCIGENVKEYKIISREELVIRLSNNYEIHIYDKTTQYESFHIFPKGIHI